MGRNNLIIAKGLVLIALAFLTSCRGFFGEKTDPSFIDVPVYTNRQVAYVPIQPVWDGFMRPVDIIIGYDELVYVADAGSEEIISFDVSGAELGRFPVPGITDIAMDRTLDILAIGEFDSLFVDTVSINPLVLDSTVKTFSTVYRIELKSPNGYGLDNAFIERKVVHPFYFKTNDDGDDLVEHFSGIAVRGDNKYYVTRTGPNNTGSQFGGPDDAVLLFREDDTYETPISVLTTGGLFRDYFKDPSSIVTRAQPPQSPFVNESGDFIFASVSSSSLLKVQYIEANESAFGLDYQVRDMITGDTTKAEGFLYTPDRFAAPVDVTYSGDGTNYIFVVDSEKDSLYQFTSTGLEGVQPPAGSSDTKNILASFGGTGIGLTQFDNPSAVAYYRQIVYVADEGNQRILRFKLTTDFD